jgi:hypothetical protein
LLESPLIPRVQLPRNPSGAKIQDEESRNPRALKVCKCALLARGRPSLGFVLTGRWAELSDLLPADLTDYGGHFAAFIEVRKCDKFREGSVVPFVDSGEVKGACNLLRVFMGLMPERTELLPLFRRIDRGKVRGQYFRTEGIGYSRMSECVKAALLAIGEDPSRYGLHSFRSGGATEVASRPDFDPRGLEKHGGWAPNSGSMPGYIEDSAVVAMIVPNLLAL